MARRSPRSIKRKARKPVGAAGEPIEQPTPEMQRRVPDELGEPEWQIDGFLYVKSRGRAVPIGDKMQMTVGVRFTGGIDEAAYVAPGG